MAILQDTDPDIHQEFMDINVAVNKRQIPFCAIGVGYALKHINRIIKSLEDLWVLHRVPVLERDSSLELQNLVGSLKKHTLWQANQQLHARNTMICNRLS